MPQSLYAIRKTLPGAKGRDFYFCLVALGALLALGVLPAAQAQVPTDTTAHTPPRRATLVGWADRLHIAIRDRRHAHGGLFYDRGLLRRFTPSMDHEYDIDLRTYRFTFADDADWYDSATAFRTYMGSINRSRFATASHFRSHIALDERQTVLLTGLQQEDLRAERFFVEVGYRYRLGPHHFGFDQTLASYKPDLDFGLFYTFAAAPVGTLRLALTLLDVANNFIFDILGADPTLEDTVRSYRRPPRLLTAQWISPTWRNLRGEVHAGVQPPARAEVHSQARPAQRFTWEDRLHYVGALLEARFGPVTLGAMYRETYTRIRRGAPPGSVFTSDFASAQASRTLTLYGLASRWRLHAEAWLHHERYRDHQFGTDFDEAALPAALDYREGRTTFHARLTYAPAKRGLRLAFDYIADGRTYNDDLAILNQYLRFRQHTPNGRFALQVGYAFSRRTYVAIGGAFDAGGDPFHKDRSLTRYDGGFARVVIAY